MNNYYTGVGSRSTPSHILEVMTQLAKKLAIEGWTLRSGGALGADSAFEYGASLVGGSKEIYRPSHVNRRALDMAAAIHPAWHKCSHFAKQLHARNCFQVLGINLDTPSSFLVCWTLNGADIGGTRTAIILARNNNVEVLNLGLAEQLNRITHYLQQ